MELNSKEFDSFRTLVLVKKILSSHFWSLKTKQQVVCTQTALYRFPCFASSAFRVFRLITFELLMLSHQLFKGSTIGYAHSKSEQISLERR